MKKIIITLFGISLCLVLGLSFTNYKTNKGNSQTKQGNSTVEIDVTAEVPAKNTNAIKTLSSELSMSTPLKNDEEKFNVDGSVVVYGKVIDSSYILNGSTVFTKSHVEILKCYKGEFKTGDNIYVKELGGFVPSDVMANAISMEKFNTPAETSNDGTKLLDIRAEGYKVMENGEEVILFLVPITKTDNKEFENCYELLRLWQGKLLYDEKYDAFLPYCPSWDLAKINEENEDATVKIKSVGENNNGAQVRAYTLEEFDVFAQQIKASSKF